MKKTAKLRRTPADFGFENYTHADPVAEWLGYDITDLDLKKHTVTASLTLGDKHLSSAGRVHGGVISAFFDVACGAAVFTTLAPKDFCSTVELKINYFKPLHRNDVIRTEARVVFRGNRLCTVEGHLYREGEPEPVAMASGTYYVVAAKQ